MNSVLIGIGFTVAAGAVAALILHLWSRGKFENGAPARFTLWFSLLIALTIATLACVLSGMAWTQGAPQLAPPPVTPQHRLVVSTVVRGIRAPALKHDPATAQTRPMLHRRLDIASLAVLAWLAGLSLSFIRIGIGLARLRWIRTRAELLERRSTSRGTVRIMVSDVFSVPVAIGYMHPSVLLPRSLFARSRELDVESVVRHELEHLERGDDFSSLLQNLCVSVLWFNPLAHYIARRIDAEREMACDEAAARVSGRRTYVDTLWKMALAVSDTLVPALASAFSSSATKARLENLLKQTKKEARYHSDDVFALGAVTVVVLLVAAVIAPAAFLSPARIDGATMTRLQDGNILVTGGLTPTGATAAAEVYDVQRHAYFRVGSMHSARMGHTATLLPNGTVLVAGGEIANGRYVATTEIYDPKTRVFTRTADGEGRVGQTAVVIDDGDVLMFGGANSLNRNCVFIYDTKRALYHDAGTLIASGAHSLTFKLSNGKIVTHSM